MIEQEVYRGLKSKRLLSPLSAGAVLEKGNFADT